MWNDETETNKPTVGEGGRKRRTMAVVEADETDRMFSGERERRRQTSKRGKKEDGNKEEEQPAN